MEEFWKERDFIEIVEDEVNWGMIEKNEESEENVMILRKGIGIDKLMIGSERNGSGGKVEEDIEIEVRERKKWCKKIEKIEWM